MSIFIFWFRWYMSYFSFLIILKSIILHFQLLTAGVVGAGAGIKTEAMTAPPSTLATIIEA